MPGLRTAPFVVLLLAACGTPNDGTTAGNESTTAATTSATTTSEPTSAGTSTGDTSTGEQPGLQFTEDIFPILVTNCSCHFQSDEMTPGQSTVLYLDDDPALSYAALIDQPSSVDAVVYVAPGSVTDSYLVDKLAGTFVAKGGVGDPMPLPPLTLAADDRADIDAWIAAGAPE